jgi:hypothetical protein
MQVWNNRVLFRDFFALDAAAAWAALDLEG